jgi:serine/threonine protein kinase
MGADELLDSELEINEYIHRNAKGSCAQFYGCCEIDERDSGNLYDELLPAGLWLLWAYEAEDTLHDALKLSESKTLELLRRSYTSCSSSSSFDLYRCISTDLLVGLSKIHAIGIVHRDLKPENIILTKNGVKFIDLGGAALCLGQPISYEPGIGPADPRYSKPNDKYLLPSSTNIPESGNLDKLWAEYMPEKFDIFAIGLVMLQLFVPRLRDPNALDMFKLELEECGYDFMLWRKDVCCLSIGELQVLDEGNGAGNEMIANMLSSSRFSRKKAEELLEHRFFTLKDDI